MSTYTLAPNREAMHPLEPFSPFSVEVEHEPFGENLLEPPNVEDLEAVHEYQSAFQERFGYAPIPLQQELALRGISEQDIPQMWAFLSHDGRFLTSNPLVSAVLDEAGLVGIDRLTEEDPNSISLLCGFNDRRRKVGEPFELQSFQASDGLFTLIDKPIGRIQTTQPSLDEEIESFKFGEVGKSFQLFAVNFNSFEMSDVLPQDAFTDSALQAEYETYLKDIGVSQSIDGKITMPTPRGFQDRLKEREDNGRFSPPFVPIGIFKEINSGIFNASFEAGLIPYAALDAGFFMHDVASQHALAYLRYGLPLLDMLSAYSKLEKVDLELLDDTGVDALYPADELTTETIDSVTDHLGMGDVGSRYLNDVVTRFNAVGVDRMAHTAVVKSAIGHYKLSSDDELTSEMLKTELNRLARFPSAD